MKKHMIFAAAFAAAFNVVPTLAEDAHAGHVMGDGTHEMHMMAGAIMHGELELSGAFTRAMPPRATTGGGFVTITNHGETDDWLVSASAQVGGVVEIHEMKIENDVMQMASLPDGLIIRAGETVALKPGSYHLMFIGVDAPFVEGDDVLVTLNFEHAGAVEIALPVAAIGTTQAPMEHGKEMGHSGHMDHSNH